MRQARLLFPAFILTGFLTSQCSIFDSKHSSDDDDDGGDGGAGQAGESTSKGGSGGTKGGTTGKGGTSSAGKGGSGTGGNDGGTTSVGGSSRGGSASGGDGNTGALGGTSSGTGGDVSSGGSGAIDSGGSGGTLGGSGGTGGSNGGTGTGGSGTGGSGGGLTCGAGEGTDLVIEAGEETQSAWIDASGNCFGVQGALFAAVDEVGSSMTITDTNGRICVQGVATQVLGEDFADYWGARLVIQLNNDGAGTALPYNAVSHGLDGIRFTLTGTDVPDEIRPTFFNSGSASMYCKRVCASGSQSILLSEAHLDCWEGTTGSTPTGTTLERLEFSIPSSSAGDVSFDFCVEDLAVIDDGVTVGSPGVCPETGGPDSCYGLCGYDADNCYCNVGCLDSLVGCCADFEAVCLTR